jgi:hypothetical protein
VKLIEGGGRLGEILQGKEKSLGLDKVAPLHALLTSLPFLQCGLTSLNVLEAGLDMLTQDEQHEEGERLFLSLVHTACRAHPAHVVYPLVTKRLKANA